MLVKTFFAFLTPLIGSVRDLIPVVLVVAFFQFIVLQQPLPNLSSILGGTVLVILGLALFTKGLEIGLFPLGEGMAHALARKGSLFWLITFAFALGFGTTIAEPALIAVTEEAAKTAAHVGVITNSEEILKQYSYQLRFTVALSVGTAVVLGVFRILKGYPIQYMIIMGYIIVLLLTPFAPTHIIGVAYDSGGVTTSTITVPLLTALGVGLAASIKGRNPLLDGFGLIAFASLMPMIFVLIFGILQS